MRARATWVAVVSATMLSACGETSPPPAPPPPKPGAVAPAVPAPPPSAAAPIVQETKAVGQAATQVLAAPRPIYQVKGRRDPFENLELRAQERETATTAPTASIVATSKLTGIVQGRGALLALVETAQGMGYILRTGDTLGEGRVVEIGADQVVFSVPPKPGSAANRVVLKITKD